MKLSDKLALERTRLANQRTFLAYLRTAVSLFGAGLALVKIIDVTAYIAIGWLFMIASPAFIVAGIISYKESNKAMAEDIDNI